MKCAGFGFEVAGINGQGSVGYNRILKPIRLRGIQFDVSFMRDDVGPFQEYRWSEILARAHIFSELPKISTAAASWPTYNTNGDFGPTQYAGQASNGGPIVSDTIVSVILKSEVSGASSRSVCLTGLDIEAPAGSYFVLYIGHAGRPGDAEIQGVLFYDPEDNR